MLILLFAGKFNEITTDSNNDLTADLHFTLRGKLATVTVKVDTRAEGNILPLRTYLRMYPEHCTGPRPIPGHLTRSLTTLTVYNGESMKHYGTIDLDITLKDYMTRSTFFVAETPGPIIVGLPSTKQVNIITINQIKTENIKTMSGLTNIYPDRFEGIVNFECTYHIVTDPTIPSVVHAPRRPPISMIHEIKEELDKIQLPQNLREFWPYRDELTYENNMVIKGNQILIPTSLRPDILKDLHISHIIQQHKEINQTLTTDRRYSSETPSPARGALE